MNIWQQQELVNLVHGGIISAARRVSSSIILEIDMPQVSGPPGITDSSFILFCSDCSLLKFSAWECNHFMEDALIVSLLEPEIISCGISDRQGKPDTLKIACMLSHADTIGEICLKTRNMELFSHSGEPLEIDFLRDRISELKPPLEIFCF